MSEVKRYDPMGYDKMSGYMDETPYGDYVRGEDYDQLNAECERLLLVHGDPAGSLDKCMQAIAERDTLRKSLDEARRLLAAAGLGDAVAWDAWQDDVDAWLEANK